MRDAHKGHFGRALILGGSRGMTGAPALSGLAALSSGSGLVTVGVPDRCLETVAAHSLCYMTVALPDDPLGRFCLDAKELAAELCGKSTSVGLGPGMSRSDDLVELVCHLYSTCLRPMVIDADALNALAERPDVVSQAVGPRILTPHIGEFRRLTQDSNSSVEECREMATDYAGRNNVLLVLKGPGTIVTDGRRSFVNTTGNPGMATGGSGDVLTGVITSLLGQRLSPWDAAVLGVHVHGIAGDLARDRRTERSMTAECIVDALGDAFDRLCEKRA